MIFQVVVIQRAKQGYGACHLLWLRCSTEIHLARGHLMHLDTLREESSSIFLFHSRHHHAAAASLPVNRCGHLAGGCELEAVNHSQDLVEVSPCCSRVEEGQLQPLVWANDEDCPAGKRDALGVLLIRVHHPIQSGHLPLWVSNDGVREASGEVVVCNDILDPPEVVKRIWAYLKAHKLQDPENKQYFKPDAKMKPIFGEDKVRAFGMAKFLKTHLTNP